MQTLGATREHVAPGQVETGLRLDPAIAQQHGFVPAGALSATANIAADTRRQLCCPEPHAPHILTAEFKINPLTDRV